MHERKGEGGNVGKGRTQGTGGEATVYRANR